MKITIQLDGKPYYRICSQAHRWNGKLKDSPEWLIDIVEDGKAVIMPGDKGVLMTSSSSGYIRVDVGDVILKDGNFLDVIRKVRK